MRDFIYLRMVGNRFIKKFGGIKRDPAEEMKFWKKELERREETAREGFIFFNNHFAGFGASSVNEFRSLLGQMERESTKTLKGSTA